MRELKMPAMRFEQPVLPYQNITKPFSKYETQTYPFALRGGGF